MSGCNPRYWSWAIHHAAFIWNHSQRQDQDVLPSAVRAGICPQEQCRRILKKYTKIEFGADVFVLKVNRAKRERFNMNSVRAEGMYLGVNLRQRGMIVKVGSGIYIRSNVVAKPKEQQLEGDGNEQERDNDDDDAEEDGDNDSSDDENDDDGDDDAKDQDESTSINHDISNDDSENDIDAEDDAEDQEVSVSVYHDTGDDEDDYDSSDSDDDGNVDNENDGNGVSVTWEEGDDHSSDEDDGIIFLSPGDNNRHRRIQKVHRSDISGLSLDWAWSVRMMHGFQPNKQSLRP